MKKICLITGGSQGIGKALVESYSKDYEVLFVDIDDCGSALAKSTNSTFFQCDISNVDEFSNLCDTLFQKYPIELLINNVGKGPYQPFLDTSVADFLKILQVNLASVFISSQAFARYQKVDKGCIINLSSTRSFMSEPNSEAYAASKGGINALTHALACTLANQNIRVNAIAPGWIANTNYYELKKEEHEFHFSGRVGKPEDIVSLARYLSNPENDFMNGQTIVVDGGVTKKMIYPE